MALVMRSSEATTMGHDRIKSRRHAIRTFSNADVDKVGGAPTTNVVKWARRMKS